MMFVSVEFSEVILVMETYLEITAKQIQVFVCVAIRLLV